MKKNPIFKVVIGLVLMTAVLTVIHLSTRPTEVVGAIQVSFGEKTVSVSMSEFSLQNVSGMVVNGKGEEKAIEGKGTPLSDVLIQAGVDLSIIQQVTVSAADAFSAVLTTQEVTEGGQVYLLWKGENERPRLIVFGDANSKRQVKDVAWIKVE